MDNETRRRLQAGLSALALDPALIEPLGAYLAEVGKWNRAYNLTAVRDPSEMATRHILDSLAVLPYVKFAARLLDVGSGAGLPGIPLALASPGQSVTLLDSNGKKARFLRHAKRSLALDNIEIVESRAESFRPSAPFDAVISRAFGSLAEFLRGTAHLVAPSGQWLAMKGKLAAPEVQDLPAGFRVVKTEPLAVPGLAEQRHLVVVSR